MYGEYLDTSSNTASGADRKSPYSRHDIKQDAKKGLEKKSIKQWERQIDTIFQEAKALQAPYRKERKYDQMLYNGKLPLDDELAKLYPKYADLRWNCLRQPVDWLLSQIENMKLRGTVSTAGGFFDRHEHKVLVDAYNKRLKSTLNYTNYDDELAEAIKDAAISGEGYIKVGLRKMQSNPSKLEFYVTHVPWINIWTDHNSRRVDLSDANWLIYLTKMSYETAVKKWPKKVKQLTELAVDKKISPNVLDYEVMSYEDLSNTNNAYGYIDQFAEAQGDPVVYIGKAYIREYDIKTGQRRLAQLTFAYDDSLTNIIMLSDKPAFPYAHNRIPFVRLFYDREYDSGQPYSPLIRDRRGKEKALTHAMRNALRLVNSRGMIINKSSVMAMGLNPQTYKEDMREELGNVNFVIEREHKDAMEIYHHGLEVDKIGKYIEVLDAQQQKQTGIAPEAMGATSPHTSGVALTEKREQGIEGAPLLLRHIRQSHQWACQMILSLAEQFATKIFYGEVIGPAETSTPINDDGDATIEGNKAIFTVSPRTFDKLLSKEQMNVLVSAINQVQMPNLMARLLPIIINGTGVSDAQKMVEATNQALEMEGIAPLPILMSEEQRLEAEQKAQVMQQEQDERNQLEKRGMMAEITEKETKGELNLAQAAKAYAEAAADPEASDQKKQDTEDELRKTLALTSKQSRK